MTRQQSDLNLVRRGSAIPLLGTFGASVATAFAAPQVNDCVCGTTTFDCINNLPRGWKCNEVSEN